MNEIAYDYFLEDVLSDPYCIIQRCKVGCNESENIWANRPDKWQPSCFTRSEMTNDKTFRPIPAADALALLARVGNPVETAAEPPTDPRLGQIQAALDKFLSDFDVNWYAEVKSERALTLIDEIHSIIE